MDTIQVISWAVVAIALIVAEIFTVQLVAIWFGVGALFAFFTSLLTENIAIQMGIFIMFSLILLISIRPISRKYLLKSQTKTNADSLISQHCTVTQYVDNKNNQGKCFINGLSWSARSFDDFIVIEENTICEILEIVGVTLIIRPI